MSKKYGIISVDVDGEQVSMDVDEELRIGDIDYDMGRVAAQMAFWGELWGQAESQRVEADSDYRFWRAQLGESILNKDPKIPEWKAKQKIEASPKFQRYKDGIAKAARNATMLRAVFLSFQTKASMLQSKGARARAEMEATGMATKRKPEGEREALKDKMRKMNIKEKKSV